MKTNKEKRSTSMQAKITAGFIVFTVIILLILWVFQTFFMSGIYKAIKIFEIDRCCSSLSDLIISGDVENLPDMVKSVSVKYNICITVYRIDEGPYSRAGVEMADSHVNPFCYLHNILSDSLLSRLYAETISDGGSHTERITTSQNPAGDPSDEGGESMVRSVLLDKDGSEYFIIFDSELVPISATISTLRIQLVFISVILILIALVTALIVSRKLSRPIHDMSEEAGKLALGNYDTNFDGGNCTETRNLASVLNNASHELSKLDRMQKDLIANVSHDLKTPLTMISGYAEMMKDIPEEINKENLQVIIDESSRLTSLVNDLIELNRSGESIELVNDRFSITDAISETVGRFDSLIRDEGYDIRFEHDGNADIIGDRKRIVQVLYNLIGNAVNYTDEDKTVTIRQITDEEGKVTVEVEDHGPGIAESDLPFVWDRYYKAGDYHRRSHQGTGLGLSIVKTILIAHGAEFGVISKEGEGTRFWFTFKTV